MDGAAGRRPSGRGARLLRDGRLGQEADALADPVAAYRAAADRCLDAFGRPGALAAEHPFLDDTLPGWVIATISLSESLVHGWDLATGAGVAYSPSPDVVAGVAAFAGGTSEPGMFADPVPVPGRRAAVHRAAGQAGPDGQVMLLDVGGVAIAASTFGSATDPAALLIMGGGASMDWWDPEFCAERSRPADGRGPVAT